MKVVEYKLSAEQYHSMWYGSIWEEFAREPGGVLYSDHLRVRFNVEVMFGYKMVTGTEEAVAWFLMHL